MDETSSMKELFRDFASVAPTLAQVPIKAAPPEHPKAKAAREQAESKRAALAALREGYRAGIASQVARYGLRFIDITPSPKRFTRGMTIAFSGSRKLLRVAVTTRNPKDQYDKLFGRVNACRAYDAGHCIYLACPPEFTPEKFLRELFSY